MRIICGRYIRSDVEWIGDEEDKNSYSKMIKEGTDTLQQRGMMANTVMTLLKAKTMFISSKREVRTTDSILI